ncbi:MAG: transposase [Faecalibacterium prausnitzii]|nr:MAG: transposase [Faecalibacterium prausnitzii]
MNKKKKSTNTSPYPDEVIDRLARAFYPAILACWNSEEGQQEFAAWQAEQAHHAPQQRETERSRRGTPCCTYRCYLWL